jgi:hypothetical protein
MGQRLRLPASFQIPANWTPESKCVAQALKTFGAIVADNGNFFQTSITPDDRWPEGAFDDLMNLDVNAFEVVQTTGPNEGPRSPNPPTANAGPDRVAQVNSPIVVDGTVGGGSAPLITTWYKYSGPGAVTFGSPTSADTSASFSAAGTYVLMLKAADGIHTPAFDAVVVTVSTGGPIAALSVNPNPVDGGYGATGSVTLANPAPAGGGKVWLSDTLPSLLTPTYVVVPAGLTSASFSLGSTNVATTVNGAFRATYQGVQRLLSVSVQPAPRIQALALNPTEVTGGAVSQATVSISRPASQGGATIWLAASSPNATVPAKVVIPGGATQATFSVVSHPVNAKTNVNVNASAPGSAMGALLTINPAALALMNISPNQVQGGAPATGTVRLNGNAASPGAKVDLSSNSPLASVPAEVTVPPGSGRADFAISTLAVTQQTVVTISGKRLGVTRAATLTLKP